MSCAVTRASVIPASPSSARNSPPVRVFARAARTAFSAHVGCRSASRVSRQYDMPRPRRLLVPMMIGVVVGPGALIDLRIANGPIALLPVLAL